MAFQTKSKILTTAEAAGFLGLQNDTVRKLVQRELLTPFRKVGQAYLFEQQELERYSRERNPPGNPMLQRKS